MTQEELEQAAWGANPPDDDLAAIDVIEQHLIERTERGRQIQANGDNRPSMEDMDCLRLEQDEVDLSYYGTYYPSRSYYLRDYPRDDAEYGMIYTDQHGEMQ